jgi:transcriptional regulator with XRE-family HTH domain
VIYREIGRRIQQGREEMGLTQEELAARLGCTQSALSNMSWARGDCT